MSYLLIKMRRLNIDTNLDYQYVSGKLRYRRRNVDSVDVIQKH